jgi:hypothetical protein
MVMRARSLAIAIGDRRMRQLTDEGQRALSDIAARHGVSMDAVQHLLMALVDGGSTQAQFNHPELGGMGQWSQGGMIMVGDMFNNSLTARVDALCSELANLIRGADVFQSPPQSQRQFQGSGVSLFVPGTFSSGNWWPEELGHAASTGSQNNLRYAFFPQARRLAIDLGGRVKVYDTRDHQIGGFSQQQGGGQSLSFNSQYGLVDLSSLEEITTTGTDAVKDHLPAQPSAVDEPRPVAPATQMQAPDDDIIGKIERLAGLHAKGILTDEEFQAKKAELLGRL